MLINEFKIIIEDKVELIKKHCKFISFLKLMLN